MEWIHASPEPEAQQLFRTLVQSADQSGEIPVGEVPRWLTELIKFDLIRLLRIGENHAVLRLRGYRFSGAA